MTYLILENSLKELEILKQLLPSLYPESNGKESRNPHTVWECLDLFPDSFYSKHSRANEIRNLHYGRFYLEESLQKVVNELKSESTFNSLIEIIEKERQRKSNSIQSALKLESDKLKIMSLKKQLSNFQMAHKNNVEEAESTIAHLTKSIQKTKIGNVANELYVNKQEKSRLQMAGKKLREEHTRLEDELRKLEIAVANEKRNHEEIELFTNQEYQRLQRQLTKWVAKHEEDTEEMDIKIKELSAERELHLEIYRALLTKCNKCKEVLKDDYDTKEAHRRKIELEVKRLKNVLIIQSWWRAVMVRRFLGEFKYLKKLMKRRKTKAKITKRKN